MHNNNNGYPSSTRAWMTVAILMLAYVLSFVDRQILNLLVEPIRRLPVALLKLGHQRRLQPDAVLQ